MHQPIAHRHQPITYSIGYYCVWRQQTVLLEAVFEKNSTSGARNIRNCRDPRSHQAQKNVRNSGSSGIFDYLEHASSGGRLWLRTFHTHTRSCDSFPSLQIVALVMQHHSYNCIMVLIFNMAQCRIKIFVRVVTSTILDVNIQR